MIRFKLVKAQWCGRARLKLRHRIIVLRVAHVIFSAAACTSDSDYGLLGRWRDQQMYEKKDGSEKRNGQASIRLWRPQDRSHDWEWEWGEGAPEGWLIFYFLILINISNEFNSIIVHQITYYAIIILGQSMNYKPDVKRVISKQLHFLSRTRKTIPPPPTTTALLAAVHACPCLILYCIAAKKKQSRTYKKNLPERFRKYWIQGCCENHSPQGG